MIKILLLIIAFFTTSIAFADRPYCPVIWGPGGTALVIAPGGLSTTVSSLAADGTVGAPSMSFSSDTDTGIYRIGANDMGLAAAGVLGLELKKASGAFVNAGIGGAASTSDAFPLYIKRTVTGAANVLTENENNSAGDGVKYQLKAGAGGSVFEMGLFANGTAAPAAYSGGPGTIRATDSTPGIALIADGAATGYMKFYAGGNGAGNLVFTVDQYGPWLNPNAAAKPTCTSALRGHLYYVASGTGTADEIDVCLKTHLDAYAWASVVTGP
jgi:hypothetical protein